MFISLGPYCHPSGNLKKLNLRKQSLPFDWLMCNGNRGFEYVNNLINTNFSNFTTNLIYNHRGKVISKDYDYVQFFHHDLLKNVNDNMGDKVEETEETLIEVMNKRGKRFMDIISNENNEVVFLYALHHTQLIKDGLINNQKLYQDMIKFDTNLNIKCNFKVLVYLFNNNEDYNLTLPDEVENLNNFIFDKYIRNQNVSRVYGDVKDFKQLLEKNKLLN
uniref:Uncharacterized protein n=1 Tax=viral metagenome TaxID=1070528 RepID=A0A6C0LH98_9ZZZZ